LASRRRYNISEFNNISYLLSKISKFYKKNMLECIMYNAENMKKNRDVILNFSVFWVALIYVGRYWEKTQRTLIFFTVFYSQIKAVSPSPK
jgi:hypothetical protein